MESSLLEYLCINRRMISDMMAVQFNKRGYSLLGNGKLKSFLRRNRHVSAATNT
jgi:hypothetical protein